MAVLQKQITELIMIEIFLFIIPCLEDGMPVMDSIAQKVLHYHRTGMFLVSFEPSPPPLQEKKRKSRMKRVVYLCFKWDVLIPGSPSEDTLANYPRRLKSIKPIKSLSPIRRIHLSGETRQPLRPRQPHFTLPSLIEPDKRIQVMKRPLYYLTDKSFQLSI